MTIGCFSFGDFSLDMGNRQLRRGGQPVELSSRYLDALALLVRDAGRLVPKERFMDEVWRGVPVTDEALTQCIKTLRRQLGDDVARPRFIETVPKHGYRFIAPLSEAGGSDGKQLAPGAVEQDERRQRLTLALTGTAGGALAGVIGGLFYGFVAAGGPSGAGMGSVSVVLVILCVTVLIAALGAVGVVAGIAAVGMPAGKPAHWSIAGGALGGLVVGALVKLIGLDAIQLLFGRAPSGITGPFEGVLLGAAVGLAAWVGLREDAGRSIPRASAWAALIGGCAGLVIGLSGGRLMAGSLDRLARGFPESRLRLDQIGSLAGESGFGPVSQVMVSVAEGALFAACIVVALVTARHRAKH